MSVQAITAALAASGVGPSEKLLLIVLANYADDEMKCWPSLKRLTADTSMSERTVQRAFKALEEAGLVQRKARSRPDGSRSSDLIVLCFLGPVILTPPPVNLTPGGDTVTPPPVTLTPLTTFEPSKNHQVSEAKASSTGAKRGTRLPDDWKLSDPERHFAISLGLKPEEITNAADEFRDYWIAKPGKDGAKLDWSATWRNWARRRAGDRPRMASAPRQSQAHRQVAASFADVVARRRSEADLPDDVPVEWRVL